MSQKIKLDASIFSEEARNLKRFLERKIVGQQRAIDRLVAAYEFWLSPIRQAEKPVITALFLGPSGVGKTRIAEALSEFFFRDKNALTKIECANFKESHEVAKLIGSPPGYIGYNEPPLFSQGKIDNPAFLSAIRRFNESDPRAKELNKEILALKEKLNSVTLKDTEKKTIEEEIERKMNSLLLYLSISIGNQRLLSVILFDEFEKGHEALRHFLLEVSSKGRTRLGNGEETVFYNSFIILTSNVASRTIAKTLKNQESIGFVGGVATAADKEEAVYRQAIRELKKYVEPEFLGRIGKDIVVFKPFTREQLAEIAHREIVEFVNHLKRTFSVKLFISAQAKEFILNQSLDHPEYGARLIADKVEKYLIIPVARMINSGQIEKNDKVFVKWEDGELVFLKNSK